MSNDEKRADASLFLADVVEQIEHGADAAVGVGGWIRRLAADEALDGGALTEAVGQPTGAQWGTLARELFGSLYGLGVERVETPAEGLEWVGAVLDAAAATPAWAELQSRAEGDPWACSMATASMLEVVRERVPVPTVDRDEAQAEVEWLEDLARQTGTPVAAEQMAAARAALDRAKAQSASAVAAVKAGGKTLGTALAKAATRASTDIREAQEACIGLGIGSDPGTMARTTAPRKEVLARLAKDARLKRIAALAGRMRAFAVAEQVTKSEHGREEVYSATLGSDVQRAMPSELLLLADEETETLFARRMYEGALAQYALRGKAPESHGPIVVCIDESGSMAGAPHEWAKAVALALMEISARQRRAFALVHFDARVTRVDEFADPRALSWEPMAEAVSYFSGGGTDIARAHARALDIIGHGGAFRRADVVVITDGMSDMWSMRTSIEAGNAAGVRTHGVYLGTSAPDEWRKLSASTAEIALDETSGTSEKLSDVFSL